MSSYLDKISRFTNVVGSYVTFRGLELAIIVGGAILPENLKSTLDEGLFRLIGAGVSPWSDEVDWNRTNVVKTITIVVVGGSYAGTATCKELERRLLALNVKDIVGTVVVKIILIERSDSMFHCVGAARGLSDASTASKLFIPYDKLFLGTVEKPLIKTQGQATLVVIGQVYTGVQVDEIQKNELQCTLLPWRDCPDDATTINFDFCVVATGSKQHEPWKLASVDGVFAPSHRILQLYRNLSKDIQVAHCIVVIGGGAVGIEVAGELGSSSKAKIVLIEAGPTLLPSFPKEYDGLKKQCLKKLKALGVEVILGEKCVLDSSDIRGLTWTDRVVTNCDGLPLQVKTEAGKTFYADLKLVCLGNMGYNSQFIDSLGSNLVTERIKEIKVLPTLQLDAVEDGKLKYPHIFAVGDVTSTKKPKLVVHAGLEATLTAKNIAVLVEKSLKGEPWPKLDKFPSYIPPGAVIMIGKGGASILPVVGTLGDAFSWAVKSRDAMVGQFWSSLGYITPESQIDEMKI